MSLRRHERRVRLRSDAIGYAGIFSKFAGREDPPPGYPEAYNLCFV